MYMRETDRETEAGRQTCREKKQNREHLTYEKEIFQNNNTVITDSISFAHFLYSKFSVNI